MTKYEDVAGPLLASMISSPLARVVVTNEDAYSIAMWAVASVLISSTVDESISRLSPEIMRTFREDGLEGMEVSVAVLSFLNTGEMFGGDSVGSTYIRAKDTPETDALGLIFLDKVVILVGVGFFSWTVERASRLLQGAVASFWPTAHVLSQQGWPTRSQAPDTSFLAGLDLDELSRSFFVPPTRVDRSDGKTRHVLSGFVSLDEFLASGVASPGDMISVLY